MTTIQFSSNHLRKLLRINSYPYSETSLMVFGLRGTRPISPNFDTFKTEHTIKENPVNYNTPNCTIGIWNPIENKIALFPGSTVPHINYIKKQKEKLVRANCMMSGFYDYYEKGIHNPNPKHAHKALKLATNIFLRRSFNDLVYDNNDIVEVGNPNDNIHAAYCDTLDGIYSSAGCQVIVGQPLCTARNNSPNTGYWAKFYDIIYNKTIQTRFDYSLFRFADAYIVSQQLNQPMEARLRFGSKGNLVKDLQDALAKKGYFYTLKDASFAKNTLDAVLKFQEDTFGSNNADGVVGKQTALKLGLKLPLI